MTASTDPLAYLDTALDQVEGLLEGTRADDPRPTPCRSWTVGDLVRHVVDDLTQFTKSASGGRGEFAKIPPPLEGDPLETFHERRAALVGAWREVDLAADPTRSFALTQQVAEFAVHAWDLATATGSKADFDESVAETALAWAKQALKPEYRGSEDDGMSFGPEVAVSDDAPAYDRLAAFFGRTP